MRQTVCVTLFGSCSQREKVRLNRVLVLLMGWNIGSGHCFAQKCRIENTSETEFRPWCDTKILVLIIINWNAKIFTQYLLIQSVALLLISSNKCWQKLASSDSQFRVLDLWWKFDSGKVLVQLLVFQQHLTWTKLKLKKRVERYNWSIGTKMIYYVNVSNQLRLTGVHVGFWIAKYCSNSNLRQWTQI